jgi:PKD repeat protein
MKIFFKAIIILLIGLLTGSCSKDDILDLYKPAVDFSFTGANLPAPALVSFNSFSTEATTYFWEFGDGSVSIEKNPQHNFTKGGNYSVKLTITSPKGANSTTKTVTISNAISKVKITKIDVVAIPSTNGILNWDTSTDKPDIYIKLFDETGAAGPRTNTIWNFIPSLATTYSVTFTNPITSTDLINSIIKVQVWDDDSDNNSTGLNGDDKIGEVPFTIRNYTSGTNKYPTMVSETSNGTMVTIYMTWE